MKLVIVSGRSGSGKSTALRALEDCGYHCIDNIPVTLLPALVARLRENGLGASIGLAVCVDSRSAEICQLPAIRQNLTESGVDCETVYLHASSATLVKRFSETRRRHPLTGPDIDLREAISREKQLLSGVASIADLTIDTSQMPGPTLAGMVSERLAAAESSALSLLFQSFGFKYGVPVDADMVFDLRCLPNPYWAPELRPLTGLDEPVRAYLDRAPEAGRMFEDINEFLGNWLPKFEAGRRSYFTVAVGCTGGQHRSVYMAERLRAHFAGRYPSVLVRHRQLATDNPDLAPKVTKPDRTR